MLLRSRLDRDLAGGSAVSLRPDLRLDPRASTDPSVRLQQHGPIRPMEYTDESGIRFGCAMVCLISPILTVGGVAAWWFA